MELVLSAARSGQEHVGYVGAGNEKQEGDGHHQYLKRAARVSRDPFMKRCHAIAHLFVGLGVVKLKACGDRRELGLGFSERYAAGEPTDNAHAVGAPEARLVQERGIPSDGYPQIGVPERIAKGARHDAENAVSDAIEVDRAADDRRVFTVVPAPESPRKNDDRLETRPSVRVVERTSFERRHSQNVEEVSRHLAREDDYRVSAFEQHALVEPVIMRRHVGKGRRLGAPIEIVRARDLCFVPSALRVFSKIETSRSGSAKGRGRSSIA